jgi:YfiH family protein
MEPFQIASAKQPSLFILSPWVQNTPGLTAGITGRHGGESREPWSALNVGLHVGDEPAAVVRNRRRVAEALDWPFEAWTCAEQVHGDRVRRITEQDRGRGKDARETAIADTDSLMTDVPGILLTSFYADCVPLFFHDPDHGAVALAHAGWKGTVLEIAAKTIMAMSTTYGSRPERIRGAVGPAIGDCCYEVDEPVISRIIPLVQELSKSDGIRESGMINYAETGKARLNLKEINRQIMIKAGILPMNIEITERCTGCERDLFYSHRRENGNTGRMASWIGMERGEDYL